MTNPADSVYLLHLVSNKTTSHDTSEVTALENSCKLVAPAKGYSISVGVLGGVRVLYIVSCRGSRVSGRCQATSYGLQRQNCMPGAASAGLDGPEYH